jgi:hypothetical protein
MHLLVQTSIASWRRFHFFLGIALYLAPALVSASGYYNTTFGFRAGTPKLVFTTTAQSLAASLCSGIVTVQSQNSNGTAKNVASNLTVNLTAPASISFYSDADCMVPITSVVIATGTNAGSFYFLDTSAGSHAIAGTSAGYLDAGQTETVSGNNFVWTGGGGNTSWSTGGNWSGGSAPNNTQIAIFDSTCTVNCSPNITADPNVKGVRVHTGYAGTITQDGGVAMSIGASGWIQLAGNFAGGNSGITVTNGRLGLGGGTWTSTSGQLYIVNGYSCTTDVLIRKTGGAFSHNNGVVKLAGMSAGFCASALSIASNSALNFYSLTFDNYYSGVGSGSAFSADQALNVANVLTIGASQGVVQVNSATINLSGSLLSTAGGAGGSAVINITGNTAQVYTGTASGTVPKIVVNTSGSFVPDIGATLLGTEALDLQAGTFTAPTGTLKLKNSVGCSTANLFNISGGAFNHSNGKVLFTAATTGYCYPLIPITSIAAFNFYDIEFDQYYASSGASLGYTANQPVNVAGSFTQGAGQGSISIESGTFNVSGNLVALSGAGGGNATINVVGNAAQLYTGSATAFLPKIVLNTSGSLGPNAGVTAFGAQALTLTAGTFTAPTGILHLREPNSCVNVTVFDHQGGVFTHSSGTMKVSGASSGFCNSQLGLNGAAPLNLSNLELDTFYSSVGNGTVLNAIQAVNLAGNLTVGATQGLSGLNSGTINLSGNYTLNSGFSGGAATVNFVGSGTQTLTKAAGATANSGATSINQTGAGNILLASAFTSASTWTVLAGTINMNGYNLTLPGLALGGTTIHLQNGAFSPGTLTVNSVTYTPGSFLGGTVAN